MLVVMQSAEQASVAVEKVIDGHSEALFAEESLFLLGLDAREILRFAQNDNARLFQ